MWSMPRHADSWTPGASQRITVPGSREPPGGASQSTPKTVETNATGYKDRDKATDKALDALSSSPLATPTSTPTQTPAPVPLRQPSTSEVSFLPDDFASRTEYQRLHHPSLERSSEAARNPMRSHTEILDQFQRDRVAWKASQPLEERASASTTTPISSWKTQSYLPPMRSFGGTGLDEAATARGTGKGTEIDTAATNATVRANATTPTLSATPAPARSVISPTQSWRPSSAVGAEGPSDARETGSLGDASANKGAIEQKKNTDSTTNSGFGMSSQPQSSLSRTYGYVPGGI